MSAILPDASSDFDPTKDESGQSIGEVLEAAIDALNRRQFLSGLAADFDALRSNPDAWAQELEERAEWDTMTQAN